MRRVAVIPTVMVTALRALSLLGLLAGSLSAQAPATKRPPNIVYMLVDELGYYELSCLGHPHIQTPNLDRMAKEGMRFTQYLAGSAVCAPTRACLMTGKHSGHTSVRSNGGGTPLRAEEETVASLLKQRGYATGGFGKWGCGGRGSTGVPEKHGFDTFVGYYDQVHAHAYFPPYILENSKELVLEGNEGGREGPTYSHYVIVNRAMQFVREHKDEPFFCYMPVTPPHGMFDIPDEDPAWQIYKDKPWPMDARRYAAMVSMLDRQIGDMLSLLKELKLDEDTIVIFSGDNGGADYFRSEEHPRGFHAANVDPKTGTEFRGTKGKLYEGGLRVPMIVRWPTAIAEGQVTDHLCYFPDFLPTALEIAGIEPPKDIDGLSFAPTLRGGDSEPQDAQHKYLYWEYGAQIAVRKDNWKAVRPGKNKAWQLFNLQDDPSESKDLAAAKMPILINLKQLAKEAHEPVREGTFTNRDLHRKDQRAKWGSKTPPRRNRGRKQKAANRMPKTGLLPNDKWKVAHASSESTPNGKHAANAIDGNPETIWHTAWQGGLKKHPHELVIDLGESTTLHGFCVLTRQDNGWNGAIAKCELSVSDDPKHFAGTHVAATLKKTKQAQSIRCDAATGRYVRLRILSEVGGGPWASLAEFGLLQK